MERKKRARIYDNLSCARARSLSLSFTSPTFEIYPDYILEKAFPPIWCAICRTREEERRGGLYLANRYTVFGYSELRRNSEIPLYKSELKCKALSTTTSNTIAFLEFSSG